MIKRLIEKLYFYLEDVDLESPDFTDEEVAGMFDELSRNEDLKAFLKYLIVHDTKEYFKASSESDRDKIKGKYIRAKYLYRKLLAPQAKKKEKPVERADRKVAGRYG